MIDIRLYSKQKKETAKDNSNLLALLYQLDTTLAKLKNNKLSKKELESMLENLIKSNKLKGEKGDRGEKGEKGEKGDTPLVDYKSIKKNVLKEIPKPKDGKDGKDGISPDIEKIKKDILKAIPKPKNNKPTLITKRIDLKPSEIVEKLESLKGSERLSAKAIKDLEKYIKRQAVYYGGGGGGISDAPKDGKQYGRQDGTWTEVTGGGGGGAVDSVFGRTGNVVAVSGDYTTDQVTEGANKYWDYNADSNPVINITDPTNPQDAATKNYVDTKNQDQVENAGVSTDNAIPKFDGTTGKIIKNTGVTIDDLNNISTPGTVDGRNISADGAKLDTIETGAEVNNISDANASTLTDGSNADALHVHTASAITDFDAEVSNNTDVSSNTAKRHDPVTATDSSNIDLTLTGQNITADLTDTAVTPGSYTNSDLTVDAKGRITAISNGSGGGTVPILNDGRLTPTSGVAYVKSNVTGSSNLYFTAYKGNRQTVWDGSNFVVRTFNEISFSNSTTIANSVYDMFIYDNAGTLALERVRWTSSNTRATSLTNFQGFLHKTLDRTRKYIGSFATNASNQFFMVFDNNSGSRKAEFGIYNYYNRLQHTALIDESGFWTYTASVWRPWNNSTNNRLELICGLDDVELSGIASCLMLGSTSGSFGVKKNSTNTAPVVANGEGVVHKGANETVEVTASVSGTFGQAGLNYLQLVEYSGGSNTNSGDYGVSTLLDPNSKISVWI